MSMMFIDASPKKRFSNSAYFMGIAKIFAKQKGEKCIKIKLPLTKKYTEIFEQIKDTETVVIGVPVYVDGLPSHVLNFLDQLKYFCEKEGITFTLYVISNCGFYEGHQTKHLLMQAQIWCKKANIKWGGGLGIGAGEMLGFLRLLPIIFIGISIVMLSIELVQQILSSQISFKLLISNMGLIALAIRILISFLFSSKAIYSLAKIGKKIKKGEYADISYSGLALCPKFLFIFLASCYWFMRLCIVNLRLPNVIFAKQPNDYFSKNIKEEANK